MGCSVDAEVEKMLERVGGMCRASPPETAFGIFVYCISERICFLAWSWDVMSLQNRATRWLRDFESVLLTLSIIARTSLLGIGDLSVA